MFVYLSVFVSRHRVCCFLFYFDVSSFLCLLPLSRALWLVPAVPPPVILCVYIWSQSYLALCCVPPRTCIRFQAYVTFTLWMLINKAAFKFSSCFPSPASWVYSSCHTGGFQLVVFLHLILVGSLKMWISVFLVNHWIITIRLHVVHL